MPTLTKEVDGRPITVTTEVPREIVTLRSQGFKDEAQTAAGLSELKVEDLRKELADKQLPVSGSKPELIARLAEAPSAPAKPDAK